MSGRREMACTAIPGRLSVGIIGAGEIVAKGHLPVLSALETAEVAWVADRDRTRAESLARAFRLPSLGLPCALQDLPYTDVVLLAIPYGARRPYYDALRGRSSAIYVEKPFAQTLTEHQEICSGFHDYQIACGFQRRSFGPTQLVKRLVDNHVFGQLRSIRYGHGRRGVIGLTGHYTAFSEAGGGLLFSAGVHGLDTMLYLAGASSAVVKNVAMVVEDGFDLHTSADIQLQTARNGAVNAHLTVSCLEDTNEKIECVFDGASISFTLFAETSEVELRPRTAHEGFLLQPCAGSFYPLTSWETLVENWELFLAGVKDQIPNRTSAARCVLTTHVMEQLYAAGLAGPAHRTMTAVAVPALDSYGG